MTRAVVQFPVENAKSSSDTVTPNKFIFTKTAIKDAIAQAPKDRTTIYRDLDTAGLILRRQKTQWVYAIERRINGRLFRHTLQDHTSSSDLSKLRAEAAEIMVQVRNQTFVTAAQRRAAEKSKDKSKALENMTLGGALADFIEKNPQLRPKTAEVYGHAVARAENLRRKPTDPPIVEFVTTHSTTGMRGLDLNYVREAYDRIHKTHSASSAAQTLRTIRTLWSHWADELPEGILVPSNPVRGLTKKKKRVAPVPIRESALSSAERPLWLAAARKDASHRGITATVTRALLFLYFTGLRKTEALGLRWAEIGEHTITIAANRMKAGVELSRPITPEMRAILDEQRKLAEPDAVFVFPSVRGDSHVVDTRRTKDRLNQSVGTAVSNHDLRRTYIAAATKSGVPEVTTKMLVGHSIEDITQKYAQAIRSDLLEYALQIEAELQ